MYVFCSSLSVFSYRIEKLKQKMELQMERRKAAEKTVDNLYAWVDELHVELNAEKEARKAAKKEVKSQQTQLSNARSIASKRLDLLNNLKLELRKARDDLADESHQREALERMNTIQLEIKRERKVGRRGGAKHGQFILPC